MQQVCFVGKPQRRISQMDVAREAASGHNLCEDGFKKVFIDHYIGKHAIYVCTIF